MASGTGCETVHGLGIGAHRVVLGAELLFDLSEVVAYFAAVIEHPGSANITFGRLNLSACEQHPPERIPVGRQAAHLRQLPARSGFRAKHIPERHRGGGHGGLRVLLGAIEVQMFIRKLVGDVIPDCGRR